MVAAVFARLVTSNAVVAQQACLVVVNTCPGEGSGDRADQWLAAGVSKLIVQALGAFPDDKDVALDGCWAVRNVAGAVGGGDVVAAKRRDALAAAGACEAVVAVLRAHASTSDVVTQAGWAMKHLCTGDGADGRRQRLLAAGAKALVGAAAKDGALSADARSAAEGARGSLGTVASWLAALGEEAVAPADAEAALKGLNALCGSDNGNRVLFASSGGCGLVATVFRRFATCNAVIAQQACCLIAYNVLGDCGGHRADQWLAAGVGALVVQALGAFPDDKDVAQNGCWSIGNLAAATGGGDVAKRNDALSAMGACEAVVAAIRAHASTSGVVTQASYAIFFLCTDDVANERQQRLLTAGASEALAALQEAAVAGFAAKNAVDVLSDVYVAENETFPSGTITIKTHRNNTRTFADGTVTFFASSTVVGDVCLSGGRFYYEVDVLLMGIFAKIGWATADFGAVVEATTSGVGDDEQSWGVGGLSKWHNKDQKSYGKTWVAGDVIGIAIDLVGMTVSTSVNGDWGAPCGVAFTDIQVPAGWVMPALSASVGKYRVNFGGANRPFRFAPPDDSYVAVASATDTRK